ncbi:MAG: sigma-70 family RNA polymerase sigma factor [Bacteroidaceae bacterium]|nr:sigma-70 family RNA polymerase sigma factor [Bacteroidaceae bacterium]
MQSLSRSQNSINKRSLTMEITRLIERCRQGDAEALGELYKTYAQRMKGVCRRYISDEQTMDDVLHDAFVIIFTSFDRLRDDRKAESWMKSITRNVAAKYKDQQKNISFVPLQVAETLMAPHEDITVNTLPLEEMLKSIDKLPEGYRNVFRLSVLSGMSHNEIADMLGILPHSSSSQLARAKKILRKMMQQYWVTMLLLLLMPLTFFLLRNDNAIVKENIAKQKETPKHYIEQKTNQQPQKPLIVHVPLHSTPIHTLQSLIVQAIDSIKPDSMTNMTAQEQTIPDSILNKKQADTTHIIEKPGRPHYNIADLSCDKAITSPHNRQKRSIQLAYVGAFGEQSYNRPYGFTEKPIISTTGQPTSPVTFQYWSDYAAFLAEMPDDGNSHKRNIIMNIALNNAGDAQGTGADKIVRKSHHYMPVSLSLAFNYQFNRRLALETGLSYSRLKSEFEMGANGNTINQQQTIHYIGILMKSTCNIYNRKPWSIYASLRLTTEIPLRSPLNTYYYLHGTLQATDKTSIPAPWQWSLGTGFGLQYNLTPGIGVFAEPSLLYYIPTGTQVQTYRTQHPLNFSLPLGIRFTW